ncbi:MAG: DUF5714 domain-containing protein [bacterium]
MIEQKTMKEKMEEARKIYFMKEFRAVMRNVQGLTDEDFEKPVPGIRRKILDAREIDPLEMFERIMKELVSEWQNPSPLPVNTEWHHFMVPGIVIASLRNAGYPMTDRDVEEAITRGEKFAGGSCGFMGTCGGAYSVGIIASIINKTNPLHDEKRSEIMRSVADTLKEIAKYPRRCCKRSSYMAIQKAVEYLKTVGFDKIPSREIKCRWSAQNKMCLGIKCPYFNK